MFAIDEKVGDKRLILTAKINFKRTKNSLGIKTLFHYNLKIIILRFFKGFEATVWW